MNIAVRFIDRAGKDIPGMGFMYARQAGGDTAAESRCARQVAMEKLSATGKRVFDSVYSFDEIKLWVE